jgi:hypothetical protein
MVLNQKKAIKAPKLGAGYSLIYLPLRVGRIPLLKGLGDRHAVLVGPKGSGAIALGHQHITKAIERDGYAPLILSTPSYCLGLLKCLARAIEITEANQAIPKAESS